MSLAYLFWHRPRREVDTAEYEQAHAAFRAELGGSCASFRLSRLPFEDGPGYEDWYLVDDWAGLGALNAAAVDGRRRPSHDHVAAMAGPGWGAVYAPLRGDGEIPEQASWLDRPPDQPHSRFLDGLPRGDVWQRQLVLGPAPEFCVAAPGSARRERLADPAGGEAPGAV
jgi:hypothetical protein